MNCIGRLKARLGEFWWYSLLLFLAARSGDLIQAFIGLWLVPHYVPQSDLGAVLPLIQVATLWGLPLTILLQPLTKFLNAYATRGEYGKLKRLLQVAFLAALAVMVIGFISARFVMPFFFKRMRVAAGSLGILIIVCGLLNATAPVFQSALQGLKRFKLIIILNGVCAPLRLVVLLVTMPIRALSGYVLGQCVGPALTLVASVFGLRKELGRNVKARPFWHDDGHAMMRYTWPIAINLLIGTVLGTWQALLIRQRLPEVESAAYYIISRLAEIGTYVGISIAFIMFPLAAEAQSAGKESPSLLRQTLMATSIAGMAFTVFFAIFGKWILGAVPLWAPYRGYAFELVLLTLIMTLRVICSNFATYEIASSRFRFLWYMLPCGVLETGGLLVLTGYGFFNGILPDSAVCWMKSLDAAHIDFFLWWFLAVNALMFGCMLLQGWSRFRLSGHKERPSS